MKGITLVNRYSFYEVFYTPSKKQYRLGTMMKGNETKKEAEREALKRFANDIVEINRKEKK